MTVIDLISVRKRYCQHAHLKIDEYAESVECADCGAHLNPFHILLRLAKEQDRIRYTQEDLKRLKAEIKDAKEELERLKQSIRYYQKKGV